MKKKVIAIISSVFILGIAGILAIKMTGKKDIDELPVVQVEKAKKQQVISTIDVDGTVVFKNKISIYSENAGKVQNIVAKEGDNVSKGDSIINYDNSTKEKLERQLKDAKFSLKSSQLSLDALYIPADETQILQLETQILQAEKTIQDTQNNITQLNDKILNAKRDFENAKSLYGQGAIAKSELTNLEDTLKNLENQKISAEASLDIANQQLEANKKQLGSAKDKINEPINKNRIDSQKVIVEQAKLKVSELEKDLNKFKTNILAPANGTITKIFVSDGENVPEGKIVAEMGNLEDIVVQAYIPEEDMLGIKEGQKVTAKSETLSTYEGVISKVYPIAEKMNIGGSEKNVVKIEVSLENASDLKVGFTAKLNIITNVDNNALVVPIMSYMTETNAEPYVYIVKEDNTIEKRRIKLKTFQGSLVSIEGISEGELVVLSPSEDIKEGMKIQTQEGEILQENTEEETQ